MAKNKTARRDQQQDSQAPDLEIFKDQITLHPQGFVAPKEREKDGGGERALMSHPGRFREAPLEFLGEIGRHLVGQDWRAYQSPIGPPIYYSGFSAKMIASVMSTPILQSRISELARKRIAVEEKEGLLNKNDRAYESQKAQRLGQIEESLREVGEKMVDGMICKMESNSFIRGAYYLCTELLTRAYHQGIHVSSEEVLRLRKVAEEAEKKKQSIVFLPCHKSHVDYVSLQLICYRLGLVLPTVVSGDNLNFPVVGGFLQHAGAMYIRRSFGDDVLYTTVVQAYIDTLLQGGFNFECFIEGGRSRTGKLLSPKFGILSFILDSILSGRVQDTIICPVSTQYDKVIETEGYVSELLGMPKKKENLSDFLASSSILSLKLGRVDVRFHEPWSLRNFITDQLTRSSVKDLPRELGLKAADDPAVRQRILRTLGYKVLSDINAVSVVMPTALIGTVLLTLRGRGVGKMELIRRVEWLSARVRAKGGRVAHFGRVPTAAVVDRGLDVLGKDLVGLVEGLPEPTYYAVDRFQLSFYRNMTIHLFITEALVSASMYTRVKRGGLRADQRISFSDLREQVLFLSQLFRGEFIYPTEGLNQNLDVALRGLESDKVIELLRNKNDEIEYVGLADEERAAGRENFDFYCFLIWPFIEASWLGAVSLMGLTPSTDKPNDTWIDLSKAQNSAQLLGKTLYHQGDLSYFEAVNKETLKNAYQRFDEEGIILVAKSRLEKSKAKMKLAPEWAPHRDPVTGKIKAEGRLWDYIEKIAQSRREGKNRRDGATVSTRVLTLADSLGQSLFETSPGEAVQEEELRRKEKRGRAIATPMAHL